MTCRQVADASMDYVAGDLPAATQAEVDAHRAACPGCAAYLETYAATIALEKAAFRDEAAAPKDLVATVLKARRKTP